MIARGRGPGNGREVATPSSGTGRWVLTTPRDPALRLLHLAGRHAIAGRPRYHSTHPEAVAAPVLSGTGQNTWTRPISSAGVDNRPAQ